MDNKKENLPIKLEYSDVQTVPLALHEMHMARLNRLLRWLCVAWALSMAFVVSAFVWLWNQYDYESSTELSGVYNLVDSQGGAVSFGCGPAGRYRRRAWLEPQRHIQAAVEDRR